MNTIQWGVQGLSRENLRTRSQMERCRSGRSSGQPAAADLAAHLHRAGLSASRERSQETQLCWFSMISVEPRPFQLLSALLWRSRAGFERLTDQLPAVRSISHDMGIMPAYPQLTTDERIQSAQ